MTDTSDNWYEKAVETSEFQLGKDLGAGLREYDMYAEAQAAFDAGEIELWLETYRPKSLDEWKAFEEKYGPSDEVVKRWSKNAKDK